jgi:hypothetical protein
MNLPPPIPYHLSMPLFLFLFLHIIIIMQVLLILILFYITIIMDFFLRFTTTMNCRHPTSPPSFNSPSSLFHP